jgi:hypothetical protein
LAILSADRWDIRRNGVYSSFGSFGDLPVSPSNLSKPRGLVGPYLTPKRREADELAKVNRDAEPDWKTVLEVEYGRGLALTYIPPERQRAPRFKATSLNGAIEAGPLTILSPATQTENCPKALRATPGLTSQVRRLPHPTQQTGDAQAENIRRTSIALSRFR